MKNNPQPIQTFSKQQTGPQDSLFLPDFCSLKMVFPVVIIAELLAFILTLAPLKVEQQRWNDLAIISLFIQWNGLMCSSVLCALRPLLKNYSDRFVAFSSYLALLLMIGFLSELSFYVLQDFFITGMISASNHWEFLAHNLSIGAIISALALRYFYVQHQWRIKIQAESSAQLKLLQARIRPHFLFNSMNSIACLTRTRPEVAERITEDLAELFRMLFREDNELIRWQRELQLSESYIDIEKQRLGDRLNIQWQVEDIPDDALIPALLLQPLLENAIFHGIEPEVNGGQIRVFGEFLNAKLRFSIHNSRGSNVIHRQGNQMALQNIRQRLYAHFQDEASIECQEQNDIYSVIVSLPYQTKQDS